MKQTRAGRREAHPASIGFIRSMGLWWVQVTVVFAGVLITFGHTLDVPFYLDDFPSIVENHYIFNWRGVESMFRFSPLRVIGYLSFALNYHLHQFQVAGYHVVNILIHALAGCGVLAFTKGVVRTPAMTGRIPAAAAKWLPLFSALVFVLHPLQTQAVTYTVQRLASLAALFYISSMAAYVHARISGDYRLKGGLFAFSMLLALLAFFTKQHTLTLPAALLLVEALFFPADRRALVIKTGGVVLGLSAAWAILSLLLHYDPFSLKAMEALTRETKTISRWEYLLTQSKVLWVYIKLYLWPTGLHLDYDIPIAAGFFDWKVISALTGHLLVLTGALVISKRFPLVSFAVAFYYLAHLVESSVIPIRDVCFEHRTYLPNMGFCLLAGRLGAFLTTGVKRRRPAAWLLLFLLLAMGTMTWQRNRVWRDPILFWQDCTSHSPEKSRPWNDLAVMLLRAGRVEEAAAAMGRAMKQVDPGTPGRVEMNEVTSINLVTLLRIQGKYDEALALSENILKKKTTRWNRSKILDNMGLTHLKRGEYKEAESCYKKALRESRWNMKAMAGLGTSIALQGRAEEAIEIFERILEKDPFNKNAKENIALLQKQMPIPKPTTP